MLNYTNVQEHILQKYLLRKYNDTIYSKIIRNTYVHKLTIRTSRNNPPKNDSFFYYIINKYLNNN